MKKYQGHQGSLERVKLGLFQGSGFGIFDFMVVHSTNYSGSLSRRRRLVCVELGKSLCVSLNFIFHRTSIGCD